MYSICRNSCNKQEKVFSSKNCSDGLKFPANSRPSILTFHSFSPLISATIFSHSSSEQFLELNWFFEIIWINLKLKIVFSKTLETYVQNMFILLKNLRLHFEIWTSNNGNSTILEIPQLGPYHTSYGKYFWIIFNKINTYLRRSEFYLQFLKNSGAICSIDKILTGDEK